MSMIYKVLWIDDSNDYLESLDIDVITRHIEEHGFNVYFEFRTSEAQIDMDVDGMQYDLIVIDYNITNDGKNGAEVIRSIRDTQCFTDVVFYSGRSTHELRKEALDKALDGVFFSTREHEPLLEKICRIFDLNVKHLMSIDNVRGLVMSGVADLDIRLLSIINAFNEKINDEERLDFRNKIVRNMIPKYGDIKNFYISENEEIKKIFKSALLELNKMEPNVLTELLVSRSFSSFKRVESLQRLCKYRAIHEENKELINNIIYLLKWRNALAHQNPIIRENIKFFEIDKEHRPFDTEESKKILNQLRSLDSILSNFSQRIEAI